MNTHNRLMLGLVVFFAIPVNIASATLPGNQLATFLIHETPSAPLSPVTFIVDLNLEAVEIAGDNVSWRVASISLTQAGVDGNPDTLWTETLPVVDTTDGLWWVTHTDPLSPDNSEFSLPPYLSGTAMCTDSSVDDLDYYLEGWTYQSPSEGSPYPVTASLDYQMMLVSSTVAVEEATEEPVEMPDGVQEQQ